MSRNCLLFLGIVIFLSSCVTIRFHNEAETNVEKSIEYIKRLQSEPLVVVLPTYHKKEKVLKKAVAKYPMNGELKYQLSELKKEQKEITDLIITSFEEVYEFNKYVFLYDTLVNKFESGDKSVSFLNSIGEEDNSLLPPQNCIKFVLRDDEIWDVREGNKILPNPFPNNVAHDVWDVAEFLGIRDSKDGIRRSIHTFSRRLYRFSQDPGKQVYY